MDFLLRFLAADGEESKIAEQAFASFTKIVNIILPVLMSLLLLLGMFYGITLGVKYAKAEEEEEKKKARGALINVVVGILIAVIFVAVVEIILNQNFVKRLFYQVSSNSGIN